MTLKNICIYRLFETNTTAQFITHFANKKYLKYWFFYRWSWQPWTSRRWSSAAISTTLWKNQRKHWTTAGQTGFWHQYSLHQYQHYYRIYFQYNCNPCTPIAWYWHFDTLMARFQFCWTLLLRPTSDISTTTRCTWAPLSFIRPYHMPGENAPKYAMHRQQKLHCKNCTECTLHCTMCYPSLATTPMGVLPCPFNNVSTPFSRQSTLKAS